MSRIRTIKPEFFTSGDVATLTPLARLFFIGLWCEADKEGRLKWDPMTLKLRYLPNDDCDPSALAGEMLDRGMIQLYEAAGKHLCAVTNFLKHQVVNNRERESFLPPPPDLPPTAEGKEREGTGRKEGNRVSDASATRASRVEYENFMTTWNAVAARIKCSSIRDITEGRKTKLKKRLADPRFDWQAVLDAAKLALFAHGKNWFSFDWLIENDTNFMKLLEGKYNQEQNSNGHHAQPMTAHERRMAETDRAVNALFEEKERGKQRQDSAYDTASETDVPY